MKFIRFTILSLLLAVVPVKSAPVDVDGSVIHTEPSSEQMQQMFQHVMKIIKEKAKRQDISDVELWQGAIRGMLQAVDQHSSYLTPEEYNTRNPANKQKLSGIGAHIKPHNGVIEIVAPVHSNSPMVKAGIKRGDRIVEVCNKEEQQWKCEPTRPNPRSLVPKITGEEGTTVRLKIRRAASYLYIDVLREKMDIPSVVSGTIGNDTVYIRLTQFTTNAANEVFRDYEKRKNELSESIKYLVLDLRFNPGGLMNEAVQVVDGLVPGGRVVTVQAAKDVVVEVTNATQNMKVDSGVHVVVLVNNMSASASEIVSGALQDLADTRIGKTLIVGEKTYGKGSVQHLVKTPYGGAIKLTVAEYFTASGKRINGVGVTPDVVVGLKEDEEIDFYRETIATTDTQLHRALQELRK